MGGPGFVIAGGWSYWNFRALEEKTELAPKNRMHSEVNIVDKETKLNIVS
jgi:hypothetical protein